MSEHTSWTKGEWQIECGSITNGSHCIAIMNRILDKEGDISESDAHLIAAAPDMYEALKEFISAAEKAKPKFSPHMGRAFAKLRQSLAKAEVK